ncbi:hypothetical protein [Bradyrhizobium sp. 33ap4]|uniref:hypothetical protein n=1 Tax=Bradyrhizobium sp. 33ap4 TaxID=3061630 RepID=UPI00292EE017|nr:hypothetical protein [Bradyrhizobium sp. 33ap4]
MWIKLVAVGVIGLVGMGAVTALGRNPALPLDEAYPVAETSSKSDRLPLKAEPATDVVAVGNEVVSANEVAAITTGASASATITAADPPIAIPARQADRQKAPAKIISRHWHDPADTKYKSAKRNAGSGNGAPIARPEALKQLGEAKNCSQSDLDSFLRSVNLKPRCAS